MNLLKNKIFLSVFLLAVFFTFVSKADAATLYLSPSSSNITVGNIYTVNILVNTQGIAINNAEVVLNFPKDLLEIVSVSKSGSIFSLWVAEPVFSNGSGTLSFNGGAPTPGFNGSTGKALSVVFRAKNTGGATLLFSSSSVRANDGFGTDVLTGTSQANINIAPAKAKAPSIPSAPSVPSISIPIKITTPVFIDYSKDVQEGEFIVVKGIADPNTNIIITSNGVLSGTGELLHELVTVQSNDTGEFVYVSKRASSGVYVITTEAQNKDGLMSEQTLPIKISVAIPVLSEVSIFNKIVNAFSIVIPILALLILLILFLIWGWHQIRYYKAYMHKRLLDTKVKVAKLKMDFKEAEKTIIDDIKDL